ncbi:MAG: hypothetical protein P1P88_06950 [Bacteroidales bacterium]|nr:hypothetical protein [Bacteroidales bacterium]
MKGKTFIYTALNLEKGEGSLVALPVLYSFFAGASLAFFVTGSTALFLNLFDRDMLSLAFIAAGIIVWIVGQIFSLVQKRFDFTKSLTASVAFLLISIFIFIAFFIVAKPLAIIFIIYAWIRVFAYIHAVTFWGMAGRMFSLRQGKRLFGLISGGEVVASIVAFFSVPFLLKIISTEDLLIISGITLFTAFLVMLFIVRKFKDKLSDSAPGLGKKTEKVTLKKTSFLQNRYYKLFFVIAFIPIFAQFFVDFIFQAQAKLEYPDKESLTAFVGVFFGISSIVEFFLKTFISGRLLSKYGMRFGLLAFPLVLAFSFVLATAFGLIYGAASLFFSFVTLGRLFTRAVRTSFNDPATQILYQPLPPEERIAFQNKVESGPKAYASIFAGVLLFLFAKIPGFSLVYFSAFLLIIIALWIKSGTAIYKEYRSFLQVILSGQKAGNSDKEQSPISKLLNEWAQKIKGKALHQILRFFRLVIPFDTDKLVYGNEQLSIDLNARRELKFGELIELSKSDNAIDRKIAARNMVGNSIYKVEKPLIRLLHDEDFGVKCEAIITSGKMKESELFYHLVSLFQNPFFKDTVSAAMVNIGEAIVPDLDHNFQKTEYDLSIQLKTIELVEKTGGEKSIEFLKRNINHHNKIVSDRIVQALGNLQYKANRSERSIVWQKLENEIKNYVFIASSLLNIKATEASLLLINALEYEQQEKKRKIFSDLSVLYDSHAIKLIADNLESTDINAQGFALEIADMVLSDMHKPILLPLFESQNNYELVNKYDIYFPVETLKLEDQLADIINSEYWVTGFYTKCCALNLLSDLNRKSLNSILIANMVHPNKMIRQLASFILFQKDKELFYKEVNQNFPNVSGLKEFSENIEDYVSGNKQLIFNKLLRIKNSVVFEKVPQEDLIDIATQSTGIRVFKDEIVSIMPDKIEFILLLEGEIEHVEDEKSYTKNMAICPYLSKENGVFKYRVKSEYCDLLQMQLYQITGLFSRNFQFAQAIIKALFDRENNNKLASNQLADIENA